MTTNTLSASRLKKNLTNLRAVDVAISIDMGIADGFFAHTAEQAVELAVGAILRKNGIRHQNKKGVPDLEIEISVRPLYEPVTRKHVVVYRVETTLRESVEIGRLKPSVTRADSWRHRAEVKYAEFTAGVETTPAILNEVKLQIEAFVADWRSANGFGDVDEARGRARDDLQALLSSLGPVYEKILNDVGILTLGDLVDLGRDADEKTIVVTALQEKNAKITAANVDNWIKEAKDLVDVD